MGDAQPPPPPPPSTRFLMKRGKLLWRVLLISNFALGAYLFSRPKKKAVTEVHTRKGHKLQMEKTTVEIPEPPTTTTSVDTIFDDDAFYLPVSIPEEVRPPIPDEQQREVFKWMLEGKRKAQPKDPVEKKQIDEEKAILKEILRADIIPKF
ncbi:uncharacterized protein LOC129320839 [Prosopis cineraria]|uniref:uncharacterized protein LOC129320839 n=1 Tax=Prosopis cineraria TaxID=364024 RepID=UPI00240F3A2A|nr:uncharacterized protein LOC129320839 [Prosopis cineraria]